MLDLINTYQRELNNITDRLLKEEKVLACFIIGSMVNGDIWSGSDIDLIILVKNSDYKSINIYATEGEVPIQAKFINYDEFFKRNLKLASKLKNSRLVFCKEERILNNYNNMRYLFEDECEVDRLKYMGDIIKDCSICQKYLCTGGICTSYELLIRILNNVANLYLNINNYMVSKDAINMACTFDEEFNEIVESVFNNSATEETIVNALKYVGKFIEANISVSCKYVIDELRNQKDYVSSYDLRNIMELKDSDIKIEKILKALVKYKVIDISYREYYGLKENVYALKGVVR